MAGPQIKTFGGIANHKRSASAALVLIRTILCHPLQKNNMTSPHSAVMMKT